MTSNAENGANTLAKSPSPNHGPASSAVDGSQSGLVSKSTAASKQSADMANGSTADETGYKTGAAGIPLARRRRPVAAEPEEEVYGQMSCGATNSSTNDSITFTCTSRTELGTAFRSPDALWEALRWEARAGVQQSSADCKLNAEAHLLANPRRANVAGDTGGIILQLGAVPGSVRGRVRWAP